MRNTNNIEREVIFLTLCRSSVEMLLMNILIIERERKKNILKAIYRTARLRVDRIRKQVVESDKHFVVAKA